MADPSTIYSGKAENYARYRWDYTPMAIQAIFEITRISDNATVADLGTGSGILTRHFAGKVARLYAIEPNTAMLVWARQALAGKAGCLLVAGCAEAIPLPKDTIDLVTVAQAIHWFEAEPARAEIQRVLTPQGWLALLRNHSTDQVLSRAIGEISTPEYGVRTAESMPRPAQKPLEFYYGKGEFRLLTFPFAFEQDWEAFAGSLLSASYMPDEDHPGYAALWGAARDIFERFSSNGRLKVNGETELVIGQVDGS